MKTTNDDDLLPTISVVAHHVVNCNDPFVLNKIKSITHHRLGPFDALVAPFVPIAVVFLYRSSLHATTKIVYLSRFSRLEE